MLGERLQRIVYFTQKGSRGQDTRAQTQGQVVNGSIHKEEGLLGGPWGLGRVVLCALEN